MLGLRSLVKASDARREDDLLEVAQGLLAECVLERGPFRPGGCRQPEALLFRDGELDDRRLRNAPGLEPDGDVDVGMQQT